MISVNEINNDDLVAAGTGGIYPSGHVLPKGACREKLMLRTKGADLMFVPTANNAEALERQKEISALEMN